MRAFPKRSGCSSLQRCLRGPTAGDRRGNVGCRDTRRSMASEGRRLVAASLAGGVRESPFVCRQRLSRPRRLWSCRAIVNNAGRSGRAFGPRGPEAHGSAPSATGAGAAPEGVEIRQFFRRLNDATVRQSARPTPWHPIRPPSSRLERRPYSAGRAGVCTPSLAPPLAPRRETLVIHHSLWLGGVSPRTGVNT